MSRLAWPGLAAALLLSLPIPARADPMVIEQMVARVDGVPILLSELRARSRPLVTSTMGLPAWKRIQLRRDALRSLLEQRIDEELFAALARRASLVVTDAEVDATIVRLATDSGLERRDFLARVLLAGWTEHEYRAELRRQLLAHKVLWHEADRLRERAPEDSAAWLEALRRRVLKRARGRACIERRVRF